MGYINRKDTNGTKPLLPEGGLGYDAYVAGGDVGRVYVGTGTVNIALAKKSETDSLDGRLDAVEADATRSGDSVTLSGDVSGSATVAADGSISIENIVVADDSHTHDTRYYTETEIDTKVSDIMTIADKNTAVTGTETLNRYDKILGSLDVTNMIYTSGNLTTVVYEGDNGATVYYRDVMTYDGNGNLTLVKHYYATVDLVSASATTTLTYDVDNNLITANYEEL